jgi:hypothetical protein
MERTIHVEFNDSVSHALDCLPEMELKEIRRKVERLIRDELVKRGRIKVVQLEEKQKEYVVFRD